MREDGDGGTALMGANGVFGIVNLSDDRVEQCQSVVTYLQPNGLSLISAAYIGVMLFIS